MTNEKPKEQPLNVEIGKFESDRMFQRRDRGESNRLLIKATKPKYPPDPLTLWLEEYFGGKWISANELN